MVAVHEKPNISDGFRTYLRWFPSKFEMVFVQILDGFRNILDGFRACARGVPAGGSLPWRATLPDSPFLWGAASCTLHPEP